MSMFVQSRWKERAIAQQAKSREDHVVTELERMTVAYEQALKLWEADKARIVELTDELLAARERIQRLEDWDDLT